MTTIPNSTHLHYLHLALDQARLSPPKPTNYCVGAVLVSFPAAANASTSTNADGEEERGAGKDDEVEMTGTILSTGYTLELTGNTHAEQCCLSKLAAAHHVDDGNVHEVLLSLVQSTASSSPRNQKRDGNTNKLILYTTMEPCHLRLSGAVPCVDRIIAARHIHTVVCGVTEPDTFVKKNEGRARLEGAGIEVVQVSGMEEEILGVARAGHVAT